MFLNGRVWRNGRGDHQKGDYLVLFQRGWENDESQPLELRAAVFSARLDECEHHKGTMLGRAVVKLPEESERVVIKLGGEFGRCGLPVRVPKLEHAPTEIPSRLWELLVPVPEELAAQYWRSDDVSGAMKDVRAALRAWGKKNLVKLRKFHVPAALGS